MTRIAVAIMVVLAGTAGLTLAFAQDRRSAASRPNLEEKRMDRMTVSIGGRTLKATLFSNATAQDLATTLPFETDLHDLHGQEKAGRAARKLSTAAAAQRAFKAGDIGYWAPSGDIALYYRDGNDLPPPGIIMIGRIDGDLSLIETPANIRVRFAHAN